MAARRLSRWGLLLAATLATILRAPVYFTAPSFWAEEGTLYFVVAWERPLHDEGMLLRNAWASSRYVYVSGVLVLLMLLGCVRRDAGIVRPALCAASLALTLGHGVMQFRSSVRWQPDWPSWPAEVRAWEADPRLPLAIWPPPRRAIVLPPESQTKEGS